MEARDKLTPEQMGEAALKKIGAAEKPGDINLNVLVGDVIASNDRFLLRRLVDILAKKEEETRTHWLSTQARRVIAERLDIPL